MRDNIKRIVVYTIIINTQDYLGLMFLDNSQLIIIGGFFCVIQVIIFVSSLIIKMANNNEVPEVGKVAARPPRFIRDRPDLWFVQIEHQFVVAGITADSTKYSHAVQALDPDILREISDILLNPPDDNTKYQTLKTALLKVFQDSEQKRLKKLLTETQLVDQRPSRLLHQMRAFAEGNIPDAVLKSLWLQRLPIATQTVLAARTDGLDRLADTADGIYDVVSINAVTTEPAVLRAIDNSINSTSSDFNSRLRKSV